jgi:hypothetical protein
MAMADSVRETSPDDGIRVRGVPADDFLFTDEVHDVQSVCRPVVGASLRSASDLPYLCHCQPNAAESREFRKVRVSYDAYCWRLYGVYSLMLYSP